METPETSQPASNAAEIVRKHIAAQIAEPDAPEAPEVETAPEPAEIDPATIKIPNRFTQNVPKALEKFKDKTLVDFATSYEEAERAFHQKAQEAAQARRENEELRTRLAAAEQFARMAPQPKEPEVQADPYARAGIDPNEAIITDTRRVLSTTLGEAERIAKAEGEAAERRALEKFRAEQDRKDSEQRLVAAFEFARKEASKLQGREIPLEEWQQELQYIAPVIQRENANQPGRMFDHNAYVEHYAKLRGIPKATVPAEGNPPVASKAAAPKTPTNVPTMSREDQQLNKAIRRALKLES